MSIFNKKHKPTVSEIIREFDKETHENDPSNSIINKMHRNWILNFDSNFRRFNKVMKCKSYRKFTKLTRDKKKWFDFNQVPEGNAFWSKIHLKIAEKLREEKLLNETNYNRIK